MTETAILVVSFLSFLSSKVNFMANYSEFIVNYSSIWFNMGPSACNWIIGMQESHEKALQIGWEGFHRALE